MTEAELNAAITLFRLETEDLIPTVSLQYYFNGGTPNYLPYANVAEALTVLSGVWKPYMTVNVNATEYWFLPNGTLVNKAESLSIADGSITLAKLANLPALTVIGNATAGIAVPQAITIAALKTLLGIAAYTTDVGNKVEKIEGSSLITAEKLAMIHPNVADAGKVSVVEGSSLITDAELARLSLVKQNVYKVNLPAGASIDTRLLTATLPAGWIFSATGDTRKNLQISHTLTGRSIAHVNVKVTDPVTGTRMLVPYRDAYSGLNESGLTLTIEGLAPNNLPLVLILIFE